METSPAATIVASGSTMRTFVVVTMTLSAMLTPAPDAQAQTHPQAPAAQDVRRAIDEAEGLLAAAPPQRAEARAVLLEAIGHAPLAVDAGDPSDAEAVAHARFVLARIDEDEGAFARAIEDDRACFAAAPGGRWAERAAERAAWIGERAEGEFAPLARLERVRRDPALANDTSTVAALERDALGFPRGKVRSEAHMVVAEAWLGRLHRPHDAIAPLGAVVADDAADPVTVRFAERELVDALLADGRLDEAAAEARTHRAWLGPRFVARTERVARRRGLNEVAAATIAVVLLGAASALGRAARRGALGRAGRALGKLAPVAVIFVLFVAVAGGVLAWVYEAANPGPFFAFGAAVLPLLAVARAWSAVGSTRPAARWMRAALCAAGALAAAFVVLDAVDPAYLDGFGL